MTRTICWFRFWLVDSVIGEGLSEAEMAVTLEQDRSVCETAWHEALVAVYGGPMGIDRRTLRLLARKYERASPGKPSVPPADSAGGVSR